MSVKLFSTQPSAVICKSFKSCTLVLPELLMKCLKASLSPDCVRTRVPRSRHLLKTPSFADQQFSSDPEQIGE